MFSSFISTLQGEPAHDSDAEGEAPVQDAQGGASSDWSSSFAGFASGLVKSVQERTSDIAQSVTQTDWTSELKAFTSEVKKDAENVSAGQPWIQEGEGRSQATDAGPPPSLTNALDGLAVVNLEEVGSGLSKFGQSLLVGTSEIFAEVKQSVTAEIEKAGKKEPRPRATRTALAAVNGKYSRLETEVSIMQRDSGTYCDEPEDQEDFAKFKEGFNVGDRKSDIDSLIKDNAFMAELQSRIVPLIVDHEVFWSRYFYRLSKLQEKHKQRQALAQRAQQPVQEEDDLGWGDEDEDTADGASAGGRTPAVQSPVKQSTPEDSAAVDGGSEPAAADASDHGDVSLPGEDSKENLEDSSAPEMFSSDPQPPAEIVATEAPASPGKDPVAMPPPAEYGTKSEEEAASVSSSVVQVSHKSDGDLSPCSDSASGDWCVLQQPATAATAAAVPAASITAESPAPPAAESDPSSTQAGNAADHSNSARNSFDAPASGDGDLDDEDAFLASVEHVGTKDDDEEVDEDWGSWA